MASRKNSHRGEEEIRVTIGQAAQAITTPMMVNFRVVMELKVHVTLRRGEHRRANHDEEGVGE